MVVVSRCARSEPGCQFLMELEAHSYILCKVTAKFMPPTKGKGFTAIVIVTLLLVIVTIMLVSPPGSPRTAKSPGGNIVRLEAWNFQATPARYDLPNHPWARRLEKWLPNSVNQRLGLSNPAVREVITPNFPVEPVLSACVFDPRTGGHARHRRSQSRCVEFLAKPEQAQEDMVTQGK